MLFVLIFFPFGLTDVMRYRLGVVDVLVKLWAAIEPCYRGLTLKSSNPKYNIKISK